jgi:hypothetical protein
MQKEAACRKAVDVDESSGWRPLSLAHDDNKHRGFLSGNDLTPLPSTPRPFALSPALVSLRTVIRTTIWVVDSEMILGGTYGVYCSRIPERPLLEWSEGLFLAV